MAERHNETHHEIATEIPHVAVGSFIELVDSDGDILSVHLYEERPLVPEGDDRYSAISVESPIGKALLNHAVGDEITYKIPSGVVLTFVVSAID